MFKVGKYSLSVVFTFCPFERLLPSGQFEQGDETTCTIELFGPDDFYRSVQGFARRNPMDVPNVLLGRKIALGRALKNFKCLDTIDACTLGSDNFMKMVEVLQTALNGIDIGNVADYNEAAKENAMINDVLSFFNIIKQDFQCTR